jgi:hypothetical protein
MRVPAIRRVISAGFSVYIIDSGNFKTGRS